MIAATAAVFIPVWRRFAGRGVTLPAVAVPFGAAQFLDRVKHFSAEQILRAFSDGFFRRRHGSRIYRTDTGTTRPEQAQTDFAGARGRNEGRHNRTWRRSEHSVAVTSESFR